MLNDVEAGWAALSAINAAYFLELYERYQADPASIDPETRAAFERWGPPPFNGAAASLVEPRPAAPVNPDPALVAGAVGLASAIREFGYRAARLDPLGAEPPGDAALRPETHGIREEDLATLPASVVGGPAAEGVGNALAAVRALREVYQGAAGYEFEHVSHAEERRWLREAVESSRFCPPRDPIDELKLLERLTDVGAFERFLHSAFPGQTRFSLEGLGMLVPMLDEIIGMAAEAGARMILIGMAHRGRLNVLAHTLGKSYEQLIGEFMGQIHRPSVSPTDSSDEGWTGDVKYHEGARKAYRGGREVEMVVYLAPNPSHLEWVNPVVVGMDRACDERRDQPGPARQDELSSQGILIHGDASFPGQGIVAETLNLSRLPGYRTGGTLHIITNNQIGFTTGPAQGRSTLFASDLAKGYEIPIIHVNADEPEACVAAARLAHAYRETFRKDVLIDLIGYRRWGHNEGDEPTFTHPQLYQKIASHPRVRERWAEELVRRGLLTREAAEALLQDLIERLHAIRRQLQEEKLADPAARNTTSGLEAGGILGGLGRAGAAAAVDTALPLATLAQLNAELYQMPEGFHLHPKLDRPFSRRRELFVAAGEDTSQNVEGGGWRVEGKESGPSDTLHSPLSTLHASVEWAHAEALAFASILAEATPIRLTGQDTGRGTFSHRHAVLHDVENGAPYIPLQNLPSARASFEVWNSPLSEQATLGFEFGYSVQAPEALVLWEAQYGDFIDVPQPIIDLFIASARSKWGQYTGMVLLLPHGYEGQGPEHSSARVERFLQLAAEDNLRIANCTTAAQYFHLLRRQRFLLKLDPRPLVVLTPKSLLRNPRAISPLRDFVEGRFQPVIEDELARGNPDAVRRLVLCSGKVYYDLIARREELLQQAQAAAPEPKPPAKSNGRRSRAKAAPAPPLLDALAVARVEELYPFPASELADQLMCYPNLEEVVWLQEEPRNMGPWNFVAPRLRDLLGGRVPLVYVGRTRRASPAEGSYGWHVREQARLIEAALTGIGEGTLEYPPGAPARPRPEPAAPAKAASRNGEQKIARTRDRTVRS